MKHTLIRTVPEEEPQEAFSGCSHGPMPAARRAANAPPVFVNGVAISESAIAQEAQNHGAASGPEARAAAARALAIRELLLQRARELGLAAQPGKDERGRIETPDEALVRQVLEREAPVVEPSDAECRRVYDATPERFQSPELYEAGHILVSAADESDAAWAAAHRRAADIIDTLGGGADFSALAREFSACPTASDGGALGQLRRGDIAQEMEQVLLSLKPGQVAPTPVRTRFGWHVVRLDRHEPPRRLPFDVVAPRIRDALRARAWPAAAAKYVETLARGAEVEGVDLAIGQGAPR